MNANELRDKTPDQLREELANLKKESFNLRFQQATGQLENTAGIKAARRKAIIQVWFSEEGYPTEQPERLLVRRSLNQDADLKYHRSNAPPKVTLQRLGEQRACRWSIEEDIKAGKGQCGLDEYETRGWVGWHHHMTLVMLALLFCSRNADFMQRQ